MRDLDLNHFPLTPLQTRLYRMESYIGLLRSSLGKLSGLLADYEKVRPFLTDRKAYAMLLECIATEMQCLKATSMIIEKYETTSMDCWGEFIELRRKVERVIEKAEEILRF